MWRTYYGILTEDELNEVMPDPNSVDSKRTWETAMANARIKLRELAKGNGALLGACGNLHCSKHVVPGLRIVSLSS